VAMQDVYGISFKDMMIRVRNEFAQLLRLIVSVFFGNFSLHKSTAIIQVNRDGFDI
jgi:hypothetical protein